MQQEHRGSLEHAGDRADEQADDQARAYVPEPRSAEHDDVAVGTAHTPQQHDPDGDGGGTSYPAGTYASGSTDAADRDDVEVVDRDEALADEDAREDVRDGDAAYAEDVRDGDTAYTEDVRDGDAAYTEDVRDGDTAYQEAAGEDSGPAAPDERDEEVTARVEEAEDERWQAEHGDDSTDRAWAAEHATQLRAGSLPEETTTGETADEEAADEETATDDRAAEEAVTDESVAGDRATDVGTTDVGTIDDGRIDEVPVTAAGVDVDHDDLAMLDVDRGDEVAGAPGAGSLPGTVEAAPLGALWADGAADGLRERWRALQLRFIDEPRAVAGEADQLVAEAVASITSALESQRQQLAGWQGEAGEDTERLRAAVRQYRDFLDRLLGL